MTQRNAGNQTDHRGHPNPHRPATPGESIDQALVRMAANARGRGFAITGRDVLGAWLITSPMSHQVPYRTSRSRCDCVGFATHGRCSHLAVLLDHLGELPVVGTEEDASDRAA